MNREDSLQLTRGFESQYPYITIKMISGGAPKTFNRIAAEYRAGSYLYDVTGYRAIFLNPSKKAGIIMRYRLRRESFFAPALSITRVFLTAPLPAPLSLSLTRTSSRQRIIRNRSPRSSTKNTRASWRWTTNLMISWRHCWNITVKPKARKSAEGLGRQAPSFRRGTTLVGQLVAAGEFPVMVDGSNHLAYELKKKGAPVDYIFPEPFVPVMIPQGFGSLPAHLILTHRPFSSISCSRRAVKKSWPARGAGSAAKM